MNNSNKLIANLNNHWVYLISEKEFSFYIGIPKNKSKSTITIELKEDYKDYLVNNPNYTTLINDLYSKIDDCKVTYIIPVFVNNILEDLNNNTNIYVSMNNLLTKLINDSYMILSTNKIPVEDKINIINNNSFVNFFNWYLPKYGDRISYISISQLLSSVNMLTTEYSRVEGSNINFVVGSPKTEKQLEELAKEEELQKTQLVEPVDNVLEESPQVNNEKGGFVSYLLLGFISVILSLVLLYVFVK